MGLETDGRLATYFGLSRYVREKEVKRIKHWFGIRDDVRHVTWLAWSLQVCVAEGATNSDIMGVWRQVHGCLYAIIADPV